MGDHSHLVAAVSVPPKEIDAPTPFQGYTVTNKTISTNQITKSANNTRIAPRWLRRALSATIFLLTTVVGIAAFLYPFWMPVTAAEGMAHTGDSPLVLTLIVVVCFAVLLVEVQSQAISAKTIALLGVLVALNAVLRFAEVAIPGPGGFTPIFPLIILGGYIFGGRIGFLLGALTLLVSALITGGVGPWLPYQMLTAGWMGMSAPLCRPLVRSLTHTVGRHGAWIEVGVLALFGMAWGFVYGAVMNIWFWPFAVGSAQMYWQPGITAAETLQRYAVFYVATSLLWDSMAAIGNLLLIAALGAPVLRILRRFHQRFDFIYLPAPSAEAPGRPAPSLSPVAEGRT